MTATPETDGGRPDLVAFGVGLAAFAAYHQFKLPVVLPVLLDTYGYDRVLAAGFMSVYAFAGLLLSFPLARLVARRGAYLPVQGALALLAAGSVATLAIPESGPVVLLARGLEGIAFAILAIVGPVLAQSNAPARHHGLVIGLTATWIPVGQLGAVLLAPIALASVGWTLLWHAGFAGAIAFSAWAWRVHATSAALGGARAGERRPVPAAARFDRGQRIDLGLVAVVFMLWSGQYFAYMTWLPQYIVDVQGSGVETALVGYVVPVFLVLCFNLVTGALLRAGWRPGPMIAVAVATQAAVWCLLPWTEGSVAGLASLAAYGIGAGVVPTCLFAMPSAILGRTGNIGGFGIAMTGRNLGVLIGPVLLAQVFKSTGNWHLAAPVFGTLTTICTVVTIVLRGAARPAAGLIPATGRIDPRGPDPRAGRVSSRDLY